jgi:hypothetical protein
LRLDDESHAKTAKDGLAAIVPGDLDKSEIWQRIISPDEDELMPPPNSHRKPLNEAERDTLKRWIEEGAVYEGHWALETPVKPAVPESAAAPVDAVLHAELDALLSMHCRVGHAVLYCTPRLYIPSSAPVHQHAV